MECKSVDLKRFGLVMRPIVLALALSFSARTAMAEESVPADARAHFATIGATITEAPEAAYPEGGLWLKIKGRQVTAETIGHVSKLRRLRILVFHECDIGGTDLGRLSSCKELNELNFVDSTLQAVAYQRIADCTSIRSISFFGEVSSEFCVVIAKLTNLNKLFLSGRGTSLRDPDLIPLLKLVKLREIRLDSDNITVDGIESIQSLMLQCDHIQLRSKNLNDDISRMVERWSQVTELELSGDTFSSKIVRACSALPKISYLDIATVSSNGTTITPLDVSAIRNVLPKATIVIETDR